MPLGYAIFGSTGMHNYREKNFFNLAEEAEKSVDALKGKAFDDLPLYVEHFAKPIQEKLSMVMREGKTTTYPSLLEKGQPGFTIAHVFFFGYYRGMAWTVDARFFHRNHELSRPTITSEDMKIGHPPWTHGSDIVAELLFNSNDERFAAYRKPFPDDPNSLTIDYAAEIATNYIRACSGPEGRSADPDVAFTIGGHIHIAKITPLEGFQWIIPPK